MNGCFCLKIIFRNLNNLLEELRDQLLGSGQIGCSFHCDELLVMVMANVVVRIGIDQERRLPFLTKHHMVPAVK